MRQSRVLALALSLALALAVSAQDPPRDAARGWPDWMERWLFNSEERTARGLVAGEPEKSVRSLETALRLAGESPVARYNGGTARLKARLGDPAELLEEAAASGRGRVVPSAHYNLGNFRLQQDDLPGAIEAYKNALKADPDMADAKYNLELAQRLLEEQQEQEQQEQDPQDQEQEQQDEEQQNQEQQEQQQQQQQDQGDEEQEEEQKQDPQQQDQQESPLPQFRDLPDMTAEEAAAILEAVENMERERRRQEAQKAAKANARGKKDW